MIISEPSNPWISGLASLFSVEFFDLARRRLNPGGIMVQWLQAYNLLSDDFRMVVRTFRTAFPQTTVWNTSAGDYLLVGRVEPAPLDLKLFEARLRPAGVRQDLSRIGIRAWPELFAHFVLGEADAARLAEGAGLNTDNRLPLEFSALRALYLDTTRPNRELIRSFRTAEAPRVSPDSQGMLDRAETRYWIGMGHLRRDQTGDALAQFRRALQVDPRHTPSALWGAAVSLKLGRPSEALQLARGVLDREPRNLEALVLGGYASGALKAPRQAITFLERASRLEPQNGQIQRALARARLSSRPGSQAWRGDDLPALRGPQ